MPPPVPTDDPVDRHREALKESFPLPDAQALKPRAKRRGAVAWINPAYRQASFATRIGERQDIALPDGSRVILDAGSRLGVTFRLRSREVVLDAGRALFHVAPAHGRPFRVAAGHARIEDLHTVFDVHRDGERVAVTVVEGEVAVSLRGGVTHAVTLAPGQRTVVRADGVDSATAVDPAVATAWTRGELIFERTPLATVVETLRRYRAAPVEIAASELAPLQVSGVFDSGRGMANGRDSVWTSPPSPSPRRSSEWPLRHGGAASGGIRTVSGHGPRRDRRRGPANRWPLAMDRRPKKCAGSRRSLHTARCLFVERFACGDITRPRELSAGFSEALAHLQ